MDAAFDRDDEMRDVGGEDADAKSRSRRVPQPDAALAREVAAALVDEVGVIEIEFAISR